MASSLELIERTILELKDLQKSMLLAREENAIKTYENLKERYSSLKAILNAAGVNLTDIDIIKE